MNKGTRNTGNRDILNRRSYLSAIGTSALAASALAAGAGSAAASEDYEIIEVGRGQNWVHSLGDGETLENVLIDITAEGADAQIRASGDDWTIRNVGFRGQAAGTNVNRITAAGSGTIECVYLGDGIRSGVTRNGGIGVPRSHRGAMTIKNCYIAEWTDNGIYASERDVRGTLHVEDCYLRDNNVTSLRMCRDGSTIEGCVIENTGNVPVAGPSDGSYASVMSRGIWTGYGNADWEVDIVDTHIAVNSSNTNGNSIAVISSQHGTWGDQSTLNLVDCEVDGTITGEYVTQQNVGDDPDLTIPSGTPTSAEEAASGVSDDDSSGGSNPDESDDADDGEEGEEGNERLLAFVTEPDARFASYEFVAEGPVEFAEADYETPSGGTIEGGTFTAEDYVEERDDEWHAGGVTGGGQGDAFTVRGPVTALEIDQPDVMWVELDGERMSPEEVVEKTSGEEPDDSDDDGEEGEEGNERLLAFVTEPDARFAGYEFVAEGPVEFAEADYETPSGGTIRGGTFVAEDYVEERDGEWHAGGVTGGGQGDAFTVRGPVTALEIDQPDVMWVELDGERMSPEEVVENTAGEEPDEDEDQDEDGSEEPPAGLTKAIVVDGTDVDEPSSYTFSVTGDVVPSTYRDATIDDDTEVDGTTVTGTVDGNRDAYWFNGDVIGFSVAGDATVDIEYDAR
ncbi:hypothetical protein B1756_03660 [Natrarchaeobaculum aegyptiacum]|uniref:Right handed beta helix domain-containing protein n=2 Tax=Natrarchaeobaculum aegyptiacum TaxID=745377 RepID=A0A2Z2HU15_9EURY|nr:hypothetical protein B1756_03660 [Natrarchaeobaculum aegyptiacum]